MTDFELRIEGKTFIGWKSIRLTKSLEQLAHSFSISITDRWAAGATLQPFEIVGGESCETVVDGIKLLSGYVDSDTVSYDPRSRSLTVTGRSKTGDVVDCSAVFGTGKWRNVSLLRIASDLCAPFGITVSTNVDLRPNMTLAVEDGETAFETISRGARMRGVLVLTDSDGDLYFDRVSESRIRTTLTWGKNVLRGTMTNNWAQRYKRYIIKSQASGGDNLFGARTAQIKRTADDEAITRYRPLKILAENESSGSELQKRINWERNTRAGRGRRLVYQVQGWRHLDGFWAPNQLVRVDDSYLRITDELLVVSATFERSNENGTTTTLELAQPETFGVEPLPKPKKKRGSFWL
jgi:prophage tail gpP-like protein